MSFGEQNQLLDYGFSKAKRSDLKQMVVSVLMSEDGIPLGHETFAGNHNDVPLLELIGLEYILGYRMRTIPKEDRADIFNKVDLKNLRKTKLKYKEIDFKGKRLI